MSTMEFEQTSKNVLTVRMDVRGAGWEQYFLLSSDHHFDSTHCDRSLLKEFFDKAKERKAKHLIFGDMFDLMQGRDDSRRNKNAK